MSKVILHRTIEEIVIITVAIISIVTLIPFAVYRLMQGQTYVALFEISGIILVSIIGYYVWKTRNTNIAAFALSSIVLSGLVAINYILDSSLLFWLFPAILAIYFLNSLKTSFLLILTVIIGIFPLLLMEKNALEIAHIIVPLLITQIFSHIVTFRIRQQHDRLDSLADRDGLTGALNRRSLDDRLDLLQNLYFRHKRKGGNITSVILFDIDDFKEINDKYGHTESDNILIRLTDTIHKYIRKTDELYRYGDDEFVLVANGANLLKAAELAEKIRGLVESTQLSTKTNITASFGVAEVQNLEKSNRWMERADDALFRAKRAGKNRVFLANAEEYKYIFADIKANL
jgi:diguanylate cyclase (GGDEF)-like protein